MEVMTLPPKKDDPNTKEQPTTLTDEELLSQPFTHFRGVSLGLIHKNKELLTAARLGTDTIHYHKWAKWAN